MISLITTILVSLITEPIDEKYVSIAGNIPENLNYRVGVILQLYRLTFWTRHSTNIRVELQDSKNSDSTDKQALMSDTLTTASTDGLESVGLDSNVKGSKIIVINYLVSN